MRLEWGGDVDFDDGQLQKQHEEYFGQISLINHFVRDASNTEGRSLMISDLKIFKRNLEKIFFLSLQVGTYCTYFFIVCNL